MKKLFFLGTDIFASNVLKCLVEYNVKISLVISKSNSSIGRGRIKKNHPVSKIAEELKLPLYKVNSLNEEKNRYLIKDLQPDLIILVGYGEKLNQNIIQIPNFGIWNLHPSVLPNYKGSLPIQYSILNGDFKTGISIISINNIIDSGSILFLNYCDISIYDNFLSLSKKLVKTGVDCFVNLFDCFEKKCFKYIKNKNIITSYSYRLNTEFYNIDWRDSALNIDRKIRAFSGIKKFSSKINSNEFKIIETNVIICDKINDPGKILNLSFDGINVSTGFGIICIKKIQFPGKRIISIKDLINSNIFFFKTGDKLG